MGDGAIDQQQPQRHEPHEGGELHAIGQRARDERGRDDREGHLEEHVDGFWNRRRQRVHRVQPHIAQQELVEAADELVCGGVRVRRQRDAVADHHPEHGDDAGGAEALRQRRQHVLLAHHAAIKERQARNGHHQNKRGRCEHPGGVAGIDFWCSGQSGGGEQSCAARNKRHRKLPPSAQRQVITKSKPNIFPLPHVRGGEGGY